MVTLRTETGKLTIRGAISLYERTFEKLISIEYRLEQEVEINRKYREWFRDRDYAVYKKPDHVIDEEEEEKNEYKYSKKPKSDSYH